MLNDREIIVPSDLAQKLINYLQTRPWAEANEFIGGLVGADRETQMRKASYQDSKVKQIPNAPPAS